MWTVRGLASYPPDRGPAVVALGTFDGVHRGHRAILGTAVDRALALGVPSVACTFEPHPIEVLQPGRAPAAITTLDERLALIAATGIDGTLVIDFTPATARIEPEAFVGDVVAGRLQAREVVVGFNHSFGRGARGNADLLGKLGERLGFATHVVPPYTVDGVAVSSTAIRAALAAGDVERAATFLGRPYAVIGEVVRGAGRGRQLGFPTANVRPDRPALARVGVYACRMEVDGADHPAVVNVGVRPTFGETTLAVEVHVLDFSADLYGRRVRVTFLHRLRDETRFPSVEALRTQIEADVAQARALLR
ncbi:MAG: bifunctional riboflavin kinase/FAD synthetase [Candidatus Rokubacteria bacterium]|nr:bifunctional riboflavin kinase/FAD synthetase [Candidatus Rokubacteria bacterium]